MKKSWRSNPQHRDFSQQYCIINFKVAKRLNFNCSHHKKESNDYVMIEVLANAKVVTVLQYINVSNQHAYTLSFHNVI